MSHVRRHLETIAVVGATGAQGGALVRAILADPRRPFAVRAITRDVNSRAARALRRLGADVVFGDINDEDSIRRALDGVYGAYFVTFYWEDSSPDTEIAQARNLAAAARSARVRHVIWSTLDGDLKGESNRVFMELGVPTTFLLPSFYWDNLLQLGIGPRCEADGRLSLTLPIKAKAFPGIAAEDIGACAYGLFKQGPAWLGETIGLVGEYLSGEQMAATLASALGREVRYDPVTPSMYRDRAFRGANDIGNMFQFILDFEEYFCSVRSMDVSRSLHPRIQSFRGWLERHRRRLRIQAAARTIEGRSGIHTPTPSFTYQPI